MGTKRENRRLRPGPVVFGLILSLFVLTGLQSFTAQPAQARYASIVVDAETGEILRSRNGDTRKYPASLTKLMTLYLLFEALEQGRLSLDSKLKVSRRAARQPPSRLGLRAGSTIRVKDAISALVVKSANDVAVVVAEALGGTEKRFGALMTRKARALGMSRTTFRNASGLPNRAQKSTARDMVRLARALIHGFPHRYHYFDDKRFRYSGTTYRTHNRLLSSYRGLDGMKTGYIRASGFNLVASAKRGGRRIVAVVFGGKTWRSRNAHMVKLLDIGFARIVKRPGVRLADIPRPLLRGGAHVPTPVARPAQAPVRTARLPAAEAAAVPMPVKPPEGSAAGAPARAADRPWAIQVGSHDSVTAAEIALRRAAARARLPEGVVKALAHQREAGRSLLYRARFIGLDRRTADRACAAIRTAALPCVVLPADAEGTGPREPGADAPVPAVYSPAPAKP